MQQHKLNNTQLIGRITQAAEIREVSIPGKDGLQKVCDLNIALVDVYSKEQQETKPTYINNIQVWGSTATFVAGLPVGTQVLVEARLGTQQMTVEEMKISQLRLTAKNIQVITFPKKAE